jgi:hypothetical protein
MMKLRIAVLLGAAVWLVPVAGARAQSLSYNSGQNVAPGYEGWEEAADGTKYFLFGYMNRNWEEELDVPVGPANGFSPGNPDQGQPTHLLPRRNRFVFRVKVPATFTAKDELVWTLTTNGKTEKAYASLKTDYRLENIDLMSETGSLGAGSSSPEIRANQAPVVKIEGAKDRSVQAGQPLALMAIVTDDGIPKSRGAQSQGGAGGAAGGRGGRGANASGDAAPAAAPPSPTAALAARAGTPPGRVTVGKVNGLHASWIVYRGAGKVAFTPDQIETWEDTRNGANSPWAANWTNPTPPADGRWPVQAVFSEPGTYVLQCVADDGGLLGTDSLTVHVTK